MNLADFPAIAIETEAADPDAWRSSMGPLSAHDEVGLRDYLLGLGKRGRGNDTTHKAVLAVFHDYGLGVDDGRAYLDWWNRHCGDAHDARSLERQIDRISSKGERPRGWARGMHALAAAVTHFVERSRVESENRAAASDDLYGSGMLDFLGSDEPDDDDEDAWLVSGVVAAGSPQIIAGHPKSRKTFVAEHLALSIAAGVDWVGKFKTTRGRALVLAREDTVRETRRRVWRLARGLGLDPRELVDWLRVDSTTPFYFDDEDDVDRMRRTIEAFRPSVIFIDSLSRTHNGDENSKKDMSVVTNTWSDLCNTYGVAVSIIHHLTKSGEGSLLQRLRGSGDIGAVLRHVFEVTKEGDVARLEFEGNLHPLPPPFSVKFTDEVSGDGSKLIRLSFEGEAAMATTNRVDAKILAALAEAGAGGLNATELRRVGGKGKTIDERSRYLLDQGVIEKIGGRYCLAGGTR